MFRKKPLQWLSHRGARHGREGIAYWPLESEILFLKDKYLPLANADQFAAEIVECGAIGGKIAKRFLFEAITFLPMSKASRQIAATRMELGFAWRALALKPKTSRLSRPVSFHLTSDLSIKGKCGTPRLFIWTSCEW